MSMKRKITTLMILGISINLANASKITDMIQKQTGQVTTILQEQQMSQDSNLKLLTLKDNSSGYKVLAVTNSQESIFLPITQAFFTSNDKDRELVVQEFGSITNYNMTFKTQAAVKKEIAKLPQDYIVSLKGKTSKKVFYIISDPLCPHCQEELKHLDERLKQGDVKMIPVGWMGAESANKVAELYEKMKNLKTDSEKIALLKKVYDKNYKAPTAKNATLTKVQEVVRSLMGKGKAEGTPYIIEEDL
ncbi:disulfide isomerase [Helicobacter trogontum]|uniref:Disulfide isomerase n=2 Tax=Helicobacter trogontum TaxID=50960 RepID=A0ABQ0D1T4_9HELI|nr:disulfide isomerase [Helicobacter trogontum]MCI5786616.1 disulfide isomerase [Helicobacter trogontum]MDY5184639.1 disulfide isomerase [Helicobacter trogontum]